MSNEVRVHASVKDDASGPIDNLKDKFTKLREEGGKGFAIGAGAAITTKAIEGVAGAADMAAGAVLNFVEDSITKASDLNETMTKAEVIFGDNSKAVEDWAATMDKAGGLSTKAALDTASGFAGLFKTVGLGIDESTAKSEKLTQLGSDLASFFNTDVGTALDALKSGLDGEAKPLRQFNIFLSETAVSAELAKEGVKKVGGEFTEGQKATARYNLILQQTGDAQGDFARTSDGLANSQRITAAEMDNLQAEIGQQLLPVVKDLSNWAKDEGIPALKGLFEAAKDLAPVMTALNFAFGGSTKMGRDLGQQIGDNIAQMHANSAAADEAAAAFRNLNADGHDLGSEVDDASGKMATLDDHADRVAQSLGSADTATAVLTGSTKGLHRAYAPVITDLRTLKQKFDDATQSIEDQMFAVGDLKRATEEGKDALKDDIKKLHELEAIKHPTRAQREDINLTKDAIVDDKKKVIENTIKLAEMGKITFPQLKKQLHAVGFDLDSDTQAAKDLRRALMNADQAMGGRAGHGGGGGGTGVHRATGGYAPPGEEGYSGEKGAERYHVLPGGGVVFEPAPSGMFPRPAPRPSAPAAAASSGGVWAMAPKADYPSGVTINGGLHLHGIGSNVSPAAASRFGQQVLDEVVRGFRDQSARTSGVPRGRP